MNYKEIEPHVIQATCTRCGFIFRFDSTYLSKRTYDPSLCKACKAKPAQIVKRDGWECRPWGGEIDLDTMQPLKDGKPYLVGFRKCGNADCVKRTHVLTAQDLIAERFSIEYRTNERRTYRQLVAAVKKEGKND